MTKEQIIECSYKGFVEKGIKKFSIEELSQRLRISKKTVYSFFQNRNDLVVQTFESKFGSIIERMELVAKNQSNPLRSLIFLTLEAFKFFYSVPQSLIADLESCSYTAESVKRLFTGMEEVAGKEFEKAINSDLVMAGVDIFIITRLLKEQMLAANFEQSRHTPVEICFYSLLTILSGVTTQRGRAALDELMAEGVCY